MTARVAAALIAVVALAGTGCRGGAGAAPPGYLRVAIANGPTNLDPRNVIITHRGIQPGPVTPIADLSFLRSTRDLGDPGPLHPLITPPEPGAASPPAVR